MRLLSVTGEAVRGQVHPADLAEPAKAVRRTLEDLYLTAFVDPERWDGGAFPGLLAHFSGKARDRARDDIERLTLGEAAAHVDAVDPEVATLRLEFLTDAQRHPVAAVATTVFEATASVEGTEHPVTHRGEYVLRRLNGAWRIVSYAVRGRTPSMMPTEAAFAPGLPSRGPLFILVIGSDARPGQPVTRTRADSIHVVGVNPRLGRAAILGIPRDSWVPIPGSGHDKINAALVRGGPELMVRTVEQLTGIRMDGYVLTGFKGFLDLVRAVRGFDIRIRYPIDDDASEARFRRGPEHLNAREALALSRARHGVPGGDFGRSFNQGRVMIAALATLREQVARGRGALLPWAAAGMRELETDLSLADVFELLLAAPALQPSRVENAVVPGGVGRIGGKSVVLLGGAARAAFRDLRRDGLLRDRPSSR